MTSKPTGNKKADELISYIDKLAEEICGMNLSAKETIAKWSFAMIQRFYEQGFQDGIEHATGKVISFDEIQKIIDRKNEKINKEE